MKKILVAMMCIMLSLFFVGCSAAADDDSVSSRKAWQMVGGSRNRETITFEATRYKGAQREKIAGGELRLALVENKEDKVSLVTSFSLTHNEKSTLTGDETIDSTVVFDYHTLLPISSDKTLSRLGATDGRGYTAITDYAEKQTTVTPLSSEAKTYNLKSGDYFDNEQMLHIIRCIPNLDAGTTYSFDMFTPFDAFAQKKFFTHTINISVGSNISSQSVPKAIYDIALPREGEDTGKRAEGGEYFIDAYSVEISLSADKSGPDMYVFLSALKFLDNPNLDPSTYKNTYTRFVPLKIITQEVEEITGVLTFANEYTISTYSTLV